MNVTLSQLSTEPIQIAVSASAHGSPINPTGDVVQFAFLAYGVNPGVGDWVSGTWDTVATGSYVAQCEIGTGPTDLLPGTYQIWIKITDNPDIPVRAVGILTII